MVPVAVPFLIGWLLAVWVYPAGEWIERKIHLQKELGGCCDSGGIADAFPATPMERRDSTVGADQVDLFGTFTTYLTGA